MNKELVLAYVLSLIVLVLVGMPALAGEQTIEQNYQPAATLVPPIPPATFYGEVLPSAYFTPAAGLTVTAWISGHLCGQNPAQLEQGQVVYVVNVQAESIMAPGCGETGRTVTFKIGTQMGAQLMAPLAIWDNNQVWEWPLHPIAPPIAVDDSPSTPEDTPAILAVLNNDSDPDGDDIAVVDVSSPTHGNVTTNGATVIYTPTLDYNGADFFTYTISDGDLTDTALVSVTISPVNDPPTISSISNQTTLVGLAVGPIAFTIGDIETPADQLTLWVASSNLALAPVSQIVLEGSSSSRSVTINPTASLAGTSIITISVSDGTNTASSAFVLAVNEEPFRQVYLPLVLRNAQ